MKAIGATGYKPVSYVDEDGHHISENIKVKEHQKSSTTSKDSKCGSGKCGADKCGSGKCGTK